MLSAAHPLADQGVEREGCRYPWMDLNLMRDEFFILQVPGQRTRQTVDKLLKSYDLKPNIRLETSNIQASVELAAKNYAAAFVTETHLKHIQTEKKLAYFSVGKPSTTVDFVAAFRRGSYIPYHAQEYIKIVKDFT